MNLKKFNEKLQKKGFHVELVRGQGYFYWVSEHYLPDIESVMVPYFYQLSENTWFELACRAEDAYFAQEEEV